MLHSCSPHRAILQPEERSQDSIFQNGTPLKIVFSLASLGSSVLYIAVIARSVTVSNNLVVEDYDKGLALCRDIILREVVGGKLVVRV